MLKKFIALLITYYSLLIGFCFSQPSITWQRLYDGPLHFIDECKSSCIADSNNFYLAGATPVYSFIGRIWILKLNAYGDTIWTRLVGNDGTGASAIVSSGDGGCVAIGAGDGAYTVKLNKNGDLIWYKNYPGINMQLYDMKRTRDRGYVACGRQNYTNGFIIKVDSVGNYQWQQVYPASELREFHSIVQSSDGYYIVTGSRQNLQYDTVRTLIAKIDSVGNLIWEKDHVLNGQNSGGVSIYQNGSGYIIGCTGAWLIKTDSIGNVIYFKNIESNWLYLGNMRVVNGKYIFAAGIHSDTGGPMNGKVLITDTMGNILKEKIFPAYEFIDFRSILPMNNGDIVFSGIADFDSGTYKRYEDVYAVRTDSNLNFPVIAIRRGAIQVPNELIMSQNFPNPFNSTTRVDYYIKVKSRIKLILYDVLGRMIRVLVDETKVPGNYSYKLNSENYGLSSGVYFLRLENQFNKKCISKIVLIK